MLKGTTNEEKIWNYLLGKGLSAAGAAGLMGNLYAESALRPNNLQNSYEKKLGYTDDSYTAAVDKGSYTNFVRDSAGYGLAQWTYWSRKQNMLAFARAASKSIGDLEMQLDFLYKELSEGYKAVLNTLKTTSSVKTASDSVLVNFERPADQSSAAKTRRAGYGQTYYDKYVKAKNGGNTMSNSKLVNYTRISQNKTSPRKKTIDTLTPHCIVGQWTAKQGCDYFANTDRQCSANYVIGYDGGIGLSVDEKDRAWTTGGDKSVKGVTGSMNDQQAITFEIASDTSHPYAMTDAAIESLINLMADICQRYGKKKLLWFGNAAKTVSYTPKADEMKLTVHRWFASKACPGDFLYNRLGDIAAEVTKRLGGSSAAPTPSKPATTATASGEYKVGDIVEFTGNRHYANANAASGPACKPGKAKVTNVYPRGKHPYHLIAEKGGGSTVYGWVDASDISKKATSTAKSVEALAREVIIGKWGNGDERKRRLQAAGYDYTAVQNKVNELLR